MPAGDMSTLVPISPEDAAVLPAEELRRQEHIFAAELLHHLVIPAFVLDAEHRVIMWNKACEVLTGMPAKDVVGSSEHWRAFYEEPRPCLADLLLDSRANEIGNLYAAHDNSGSAVFGTHAENWCVMPLLGAQRYLEIDAGPLRDREGRVLAVIETLRDVTEHKRTRDQLQLHASVFDNTDEGIAISDAHGLIISVNRAFSRITGYELGEVFGSNPSVLSSGMQDKAFYAEMWRSLGERGQWRGEIWDRRKNGEIFPGILRISAVRRPDGEVENYVALMSDITDLRDTQKQLQLLVNHDSLTALPNRLLARDRLTQAVAFADRAGMRVALLLLDLDNFKSINDSLGHSVGDSLLKAVAVRLRECVRETDTVSRQGGDEFLIVLPDVVDADTAMPVIEKLLERFQAPFLIDDDEVVCSASIGVALFPDDGRDFETLLRKADRAMYGAKDDGRNTCRFFDARLNSEASETQRLRNGLRRALENGEFILHYQPQVDLDSGRIVGAEALIRWQHPELGLVPPGRFIPVVEASGLIVQIGEWVLREACRQAVAWRRAGLPELVVAVNMSAIQFKRDDIEQTVMRALTDSGHNPEMLELELTESILVGDTERVLDTVRRLKMLGLKLSIDDFGTGYSSFSYLKRFAVDKLKIDQSFIRDLASDPDDAVIVRTIIQMARSLGLRTVAEGVESEQIAQRLRVFRCDEAQGYHFARPLPADEFARFLGANCA